MNPAIAIKDLLKLDEFQSSDVISTQLGLLKKVDFVTIMDFPNIGEWVKKNEVLIIGFFMESHFNEEFVAQLHQKEIAGIITKKKFKHCIQPHLIEKLHELNIPVIVVDDIYSWSDIMAPVQSLIIQKQTSLLREIERFHQTMIQSLSDPQSINDLCSAIYNVTGLSLAIMDQHFKLLDYSFDFDWLAYLHGFSKASFRSWQTIGKDIDKRLIEGFSYRNFDWYNQQMKLFFLPVYKNNQVEAYILVKAHSYEEELPTDVIAKLQSFQSIYLLKQSIYTEFQKANLHYQTLILEELLQAKEKMDVSRNQYSLILGTHLEQSYQVILMKNRQTATGTKLLERSEEFLTFKEQVKKETFMNENILIFAHQDYWVFLVGESYDTIEKLVDSVAHYLDTYMQDTSSVIGISELHPYWKLQHAWHEAEQSIQFIQNNFAEKRVQFYKSLGILRLFSDDYGKINQYYVQQMIDEYIEPLLVADTLRHSELYKTLEVYFDNDFSHKKTCDSLYIHKNTLRARLKRAEEVLNLNLSNTDNLMNLRLAIRLYSIMPQYN